MSRASYVEHHVVREPDWRLRERWYGSNRVSRYPKRRHDAMRELGIAIAFLAGVVFGVMLAR